MKKGLLSAIIVLAIGVSMAVVGAVLKGVRPVITSGSFDIVPLAQTFTWVGVTAVILSGIAIVAFAVAKAIKGEAK